MNSTQATSSFKVVEARFQQATPEQIQEVRGGIPWQLCTTIFNTALRSIGTWSTLR